MTEQELDALCGGAPTHQLKCSRCAYTTRGYYSLGEAREALAVHRARHSTAAMAGDDSKGAR